MVRRSTTSSDGAPTISLLGHALLGLLARGPATGYALAQRMRHPMAFFWAAGHSQIYPELARLERAGLLDHRTVAGRGPRPTKEYRLTDSGRRAHARWTIEPVDQPIRDIETLHVWSLWLVADPEQVRTWLHERRERRVEQLETYESERTLILARGDTAPGRPGWSSLAAVENGIHSARAGIAWCDWMLDEHLGAGDEGG